MYVTKLHIWAYGTRFFFKKSENKPFWCNLIILQQLKMKGKRSSQCLDCKFNIVHSKNIKTLCSQHVPCFTKTFCDLSVINLRVKRHCKHVGLEEKCNSYFCICIGAFKDCDDNKCYVYFDNLVNFN